MAHQFHHLDLAAHVIDSPKVECRSAKAAHSNGSRANTHLRALSPPYVRYLPMSFAATANTRGSRLVLIREINCL
jgi:hypothetical protein